MKKKFFVWGWVYLGLMFVLEVVLPEWMGEENGVIENIQMLWIFASFYYCYKMVSAKMYDWGGKTSAIWHAGCVFFFLLTMREINWGRALFYHADGSMYKYSDMGLYGKLVHPMVGVLIAVLLFLLWRGKIWKFLQAIKFPVIDFLLLLIFIFMGWVGEKANFTGFHGMVAEELAEFGAYMMMFVIVKNTAKYLLAKK